MNKEQILVVLSACPDTDTASRIGRTVVEESLAACVNVVPGIRSIYLWKGAMRDDAEVLMVLKTTAGRFGDLKDRLLALHPYEVPEVVALRAAAGHDGYFDWVTEVTRAPDA